MIWSVCVYVCHSFCMQDYCRSNQLISLKIAVMIGLTNRRNWLTFGGDPVPDTQIPDKFSTTFWGLSGRHLHLNPD